jgi:hypothetical protein
MNSLGLRFYLTKFPEEKELRRNINFTLITLI